MSHNRLIHLSLVALLVVSAALQAVAQPAPSPLQMLSDAELERGSRLVENAKKEGR